MADIDDAFSAFGFPLWRRAKQGAGGRLSLKVNTPEEAKAWVNLNKLQGRASPDDFLLQEFLEGRDLAFDSLWHHGKLVTSSTRERLEYPFKHISLTGITGTPSAAKTIRDGNADSAGVKAVKALDAVPHGFYSVDLKENDEGKPIVTEVDGKWHTTAPLWGYAFAKVKEDNSFNIAYTYLLMGLGSEVPVLPERNLYPEEYILIRQMDSGVLLLDDRGRKLHRVL
jgi:carbamoyl-phosphate synthase large subunit